MAKKNELVEEQRKVRDPRFFKQGGNDVTIICPESKAGAKRSFRLTYTMDQIGSIERVCRVYGYTTLTPYQFAQFGKVEITFLAICIARGMANELNKGDKSEMLDEDEVIRFISSRPGLQKYWMPIVNVALCDAYDRDVFAPEAEPDPRLPEGDTRGEGTGAGV